MQITDALKTTALVASGSPAAALRPVARAAQTPQVTPPTRPLTETALALYLMRVPASSLARAYSEVQALTAEPAAQSSEAPASAAPAPTPAPAPAPAPAPGGKRLDARA